MKFKNAIFRCKQFRKRILEISQKNQAVHIGSAYSCLEIIDTIYYLISDLPNVKNDKFILSKGLGCLSQYVILEDLGILTTNDIDKYCKAEGILGVHPDRGNPGIIASTGSLGHGLSIAAGVAIALKEKNSNGLVYCVISDGELQEGSTWEAILQIGALKLNNLICFVDNNDYQSLEKTSNSHPNLYPIAEKFISFGWGSIEVMGHDHFEMYNSFNGRDIKLPFALICRTTKGKGVSFMENIPIWHYRSPNKEEYDIAINELDK